MTRPLTFEREVVCYPELKSHIYGYKVYETGTGKPVLSVVSPAFTDCSIVAGLGGFREIENLIRCAKNANPKVIVRKWGKLCRKSS